MRKEKIRQRIINFSDGTYEALVFLCTRFSQCFKWRKDTLSSIQGIPRRNACTRVHPRESYVRDMYTQLTKKRVSWYARAALACPHRHVSHASYSVQPRDPTFPSTFHGEKRAYSKQMNKMRSVTTLDSSGKLLSQAYTAIHVLWTIYLESRSMRRG